MNSVVSVISAKMDDLGRLVTKFLRNGKDDVQETKTALPFGFDCMPIKGMKAIYSQTSNMAEPVLIGFINEKMVSESGESGLYSTNDEGEIQVYLRLKKDGTIHFGGEAGNLTRYQELNTGLQNYKTAVQVELGKIATVLNGIIPGSYPPPVMSIDISGSKIDEFKTL
jgi:hypothetical protein